MALEPISAGAQALAPEGPYRREWHLDAQPDNVAAVRAAVRAFAREHGAPDELLPMLNLAVSEAATNAVIHAFVDREPGTLRMVAEAGADELTVTVSDDGRGMQPRPDSPGLGLGLPTIGQLSESLDIRVGPGGVGTEVRMTFAAPGVLGPRRPIAPTAPDYDLLLRVTRLMEGGWPAEGVEDLVDLLVPALADACAIDLVSADGTPRRIAGRIAGPDSARDSAWLAALEPRVEADTSAAGAVMRDKCSRLVELTEQHVAALTRTEADARRMLGTGVRWWLVVPLLERDRLLGLLHVGVRDERGPIEEETVALLDAIAERAGRGLANTRLLSELRRTRRRLERVLGALAEAVTVHDGEGHVVYANPAAARLLEAPSAEAVVATEPGELAGALDIFTEDGRPVAPADFPGRRVPRGGAVEPLLTRSVDRRTGRERWLLTKATRLDEDVPLAVNIIEDVTQVKTAELRQRFLVRMADVVAGTTGRDEILRCSAELLVHDLADWCVIDVRADTGTLERVTVAHADRDRTALAEELQRRSPEAHAGSLLRDILAGGPGVRVAEGHPGPAREDAHLVVLRQAGMRSAMLVPLRAHGRTLGVMTMVSAERAHAFTDDDLEFVEDVGRRAAVALLRS